MKCMLRSKDTIGSLYEPWHCNVDGCKFNREDKSGEDPALCSMNALTKELKGFNMDYNVDLLKEIIIGQKTKPAIRELIEEELEVTFSPDVVNFTMAVRIATAKPAVEKLNYPNFTYDRKTGLVFLDFKGGSHDLFMVTMYWINALKAGKANKDTDGLFYSNRKSFCLSDHAEKYVTEGYGFFSSSVYKGIGISQDRGFPITMSRNYKLNAQEKAVFDRYGYDPIQRSTEE